MILKKWAHRVFFLGLISVMCLSSCGDSTSSSSASTVAENSALKETSVKKQDQDQGNQAVGGNQAVDLEKWFEENLEKGDKLSESEVEKIRNQVSEEEFYTVWKEKTAEKIYSYGDFIRDYPPELIRVSNPMIETYVKVWEDSDYIRTIGSTLLDMEDAYDSSKAIQDKYEFDLDNVTHAEETILYVVRRMEDMSIDESLNSLWSQIKGEGSAASYWHCTNVVYQYGNAFPGDTNYLIHSIYKDPFSGQGPCALSYVDLNTSITLTDANGFNIDVPVLELVDGESFNSDLDSYIFNNSYAENKRDEFLAYLSETSSSSIVETSDNQVTSDTAGGTNENVSKIINPDFMGDPGSYLCSWSSTEYMTEDQLQLLDYNGARIVKNEIFARHGRRFKDAELQAYFDEKSWYNGTINPDDFNDAILSDIEKANIDVIDGYMMKHAS